MRIATAGSCFAQHIGRHLKLRGVRVIDTEPAPPGLTGEAATAFGYEMYSARYGNIYTVRQLLQLVSEAVGTFTPAEVVWERDGRYFDALRPGVEPEGLDSPEEVLAHRREHLERVRLAFTQSNLLVFTLGLTEAWVHRESGTVFPTAPGTIAGQYDANRYVFKNFSVEEIVADFTQLRRIMRGLNKKIRFLLTVSPVPLTATASGHHALVATTYSKSVLRAAAGELCQKIQQVDYFPSYELIATPFLGENYYDTNRRSVTERGVAHVMDVFFQCQGMAAAPAETVTAAVPDNVQNAAADAVCEDILLDAFAR